jgi:hypothetical protein
MAHRSSIRQSIDSLMRKSNGDRIVQYALDQRARPITLRVVIVGDPARARTMEGRLRTKLASLGEPSAAVAVWAVSDATAVSALSARLDDVPAVLPESVPVPPEPLASRVHKTWPTQAGALLSVWIMEGPPMRVRVAHLGQELGAAGREMLARAASSADPLTIEELALHPVEDDAKEPAAWLSRALAMLSHAMDFPSVHFCVTTPPLPAKRARRDPTDELMRSLLAEQAATHANVNVGVGDRWSVTPQLQACATEAAASP